MAAWMSLPAKWLRVGRLGAGRSPPDEAAQKGQASVGRTPPTMVPIAFRQIFLKAIGFAGKYAVAKLPDADRSRAQRTGHPVPRSEFRQAPRPARLCRGWPDNLPFDLDWIRRPDRQLLDGSRRTLRAALAATGVLCW